MRSVATVCLSVCLSVFNALTCEIRNLDSLFRYAGRSSESLDQVRTLRSSGQDQSHWRKSMKFHPATPSVTDMAQSGCTMQMQYRQVHFSHPGYLPAAHAGRRGAGKRVQTWNF